MNNRQINKGQVNKNNMQKKSNLKPLIFTFLGTFIVFFFAFTVLLPILTPQVDIPALTDEHSMSSVTSNDFRGRIDPRLSSIKDEENMEPPKLKMEIPKKEQDMQDQQQLQDQQVPSDQQIKEEPSIDEVQQPQDPLIDETNSDYNTGNSAIKPPQSPKQTSAKTSNKNVKPSTVANVPPRPQMVVREAARSAGPAKVILGSYATPMQARLVSDTLIEMDLNVSPFIKERNGRYVLQVGSFSDASKAQGLVDELRNKGFDAKAVND